MRCCGTRFPLLEPTAPLLAPYRADRAVSGRAQTSPLRAHRWPCPAHSSAPLRRGLPPPLGRRPCDGSSPHPPGEQRPLPSGRVRVAVQPANRCPSTPCCRCLLSSPRQVTSRCRSTPTIPPLSTRGLRPAGFAGQPSAEPNRFGSGKNETVLPSPKAGEERPFFTVPNPDQPTLTGILAP